jgi:hypothetical protein
MNNYLCINSRKTELTEQQLRELGIAQADEYIPENEIAQMSRIALSGKAEEYYKVHDIITVGGTVFEIIGIGHDTDTITNKKNTITLRSTFTDVRAAMHKGSCSGGYKDASLNARLNIPEEWLPAEALPFLRTVTKKCSNSDGEDYEMPCRLFLFSEAEVFGSAIYSPTEEGERYKGFATAKDRYVYDADGNRTGWWLRSPNSSNGNNFCAVNNSGAANNINASYSYGVAFGFCF